MDFRFHTSECVDLNDFIKLSSHFGTTLDHFGLLRRHFGHMTRISVGLVRPKSENMKKRVDFQIIFERSKEPLVF